MAEIRKSIQAASGVKAIGPYSPAHLFGNLIFVSGQGHINPLTGKLVSGDIKQQTRQVLRNIAALLEAAGSSMDKVLKTTVYLVDIANFSGMNEAYAEFFMEPYPARTTVQVARLPANLEVEIDAIAFVDVH